MRELYINVLKHRSIKLETLEELTGLRGHIIIDKLRSLSPYVRIKDDHVQVENPLMYALILLRMGYSFKVVAKHIGWDDFEKFSSEILRGHGYIVKTNFRLTKPVRFEIDVVGVDPGSGRGVFIDCKHWTRGISRSALEEVSRKHIERIHKFIRYIDWAKNKWAYLWYLRKIVPMIVTLTTPSLRVSNGVLIVSIQELNNTLLDLELVLDELGVKPVMVNK